MRYYLAAFDPAHRAADGSYWAWRHPKIPMSVQDALFYECASKHWPEAGNSIPSESLRGGCARVHDDWVCWYRFVDGGRDRVGRPGRYVLLAAFVQQIDHQGWDWSGVLESQQFQELAGQAPLACPLPSPVSLAMDYDPGQSREISALAREILRNRGGAVQVADALRIVAEIGLEVPLDIQFDCFVVTEQGRGRIVCEVRPVHTLQPIQPIMLADPATPVRLPKQRIGPIFWPDMLRRGSNSWKIRRMIRPLVGLIVAFCSGVILGIVVGWEIGRSHPDPLQLPHANSSEVGARVVPLMPSESDTLPTKGNMEEPGFSDPNHEEGQGGTM